jgi:hypothetical protein
MSHNIQKRDVQVGIETAWHGLTVVEPEIRKDNCRIVYPLEICPTFFKRADGVEVPANGRQIVSLDDGLPVGRPVGADYKLIANEAIWDAVMNGIAGTSHKPVSCGTVNDRSLGFISVKVADDFKAAGREHKPILNVLWGHGGNKAVVAKTGVTTVVCQNTFTLAMGEGSDFKLSIRHTANANLIDLQEAIDAHIGVVAEFQTAMNTFEASSVTPDTARKVYAGFLAGDEVPETKTGISRLTNSVNRLAELFATGKGNRGCTVADLFNGATDYYSHESSGGDSTWKQFVSSEFGAGANRKVEFYDMLRDEARFNATLARGEKTLQALGI